MNSYALVIWKILMLLLFHFRLFHDFFYFRLSRFCYFISDFSMIFFISDFQDFVISFQTIMIFIFHFRLGPQRF